MIKKSDESKLVSRGWINPESEINYEKYTVAETYDLLISKTPSERTLAVKIFAEKEMNQFIPDLCFALLAEKKLYCKLALCDALAGFGEESIKFLLPLLGRIGRNQYKILPDKIFGKKNYPLPRDIAARILIRIGPPALPYLEDLILQGKEKQINEAIDAIGFISFYSGEQRSLPAILQLYRKVKSINDLLEWKTIRAMESFPDEEVIRILLDTTENHSNNIIRQEAERSLNQIKSKKSGKKL